MNKKIINETSFVWSPSELADRLELEEPNEIVKLVIKELSVMLYNKSYSNLTALGTNSVLVSSFKINTLYLRTPEKQWAESWNASWSSYLRGRIIKATEWVLESLPKDIKITGLILGLEDGGVAWDYPVILYINTQESKNLQ